MNHPLASDYAYGMWIAVVAQTILFVWFLLSFARPQSKVEWRNFGYFTSFLVALFVEMYGFPLTIYLLVSWLGFKYPVANPFSHENGHLLAVFFGLGSGHGSLLHLLSNVLIFGGIILIAMGWRRIYLAAGRLVTDGPYAYVRHPQYTGFILVVLGFLIQWPTLVTLLMAPILVVRYVRLAKREEETLRAAFGDAYSAYAAETPRFVPSLRNVFAGKGRRVA